jgi:hypothetical protein
MPSGNGITTDTPASLTIGAGVLLRAHAFVGPTVDNNLFAVERTMFTPELNGLIGDLKGTDFIVKSRARIEATVPQVNSTIAAAGIAGADVDTSTVGMAVISEATARRIPDASYADWELDVERLGGGQFQFEVDDAINTGNFEGELQDDGLFAPRYVLGARWTAGSTTSPWRIRILDTAS